MFCMLWVIFQAFALLTCCSQVDAGGASSGSAEAQAVAKVKGGGAVKGGAGGTVNVGNQGAGNGGAGAVMNGQPFLAQVVPVGGSFFIQQPGTPIGQPAGPQLFPIGAFQQGGALPVGQAGAANGVQQLQGQLPQLANGAVPLYVIMPQPNAMGGPLTPMFFPAQQLQIIPMGVGNPQQPGVGGNGATIARVKRWLLGGAVEDSFGSGTTVEATEGTLTV